MAGFFQEKKAKTESNPNVSPQAQDGERGCSPAPKTESTTPPLLPSAHTASNGTPLPARLLQCVFKDVKQNSVLFTIVSSQ